MTMKRVPKVSIGLPVRNGERYIEESIRSILGQTLVDLELIISDNNSTDGTADIALGFASHDERVKYIRHDVDHGGAWNFNFVFRRARGDYFKWMAHDDVCLPDFLQSCVDALDADASLALACPKRLRITADGETREVHEVASGERVLRGLPLFKGVLTEDVRYATLQAGVIRREVLARTRLLAPYYGSDYPLLAELALRGDFKELRGHDFLVRHHPDQSTGTRTRAFSGRITLARLLTDAPGIARAIWATHWWCPEREGRVQLPWWRKLGDYLSSLSRASAPVIQRPRYVIAIVNWMRKRAKYLVRDLVVAFALTLHRVRTKVN